MMKFKKIWFFGNTSRDIDKDDYITCYMRDDNKVKIECCHGFSNWNSRWYDVYVIDGEYEKFYCVFSMIDGDICIECGERDGKNLKAASRLKAFSQIVLSIWGLMQVGKIS